MKHSINDKFKAKADKPDGLLFLYVKMVKELEKESAAKQAQIDSLMLEYCPGDMTSEQILNWEKHQQRVIPL